MLNSKSGKFCEEGIDLVEMTVILWRGKWAIALTTLLFAAVALLLSLSFPKEYQAAAEVVLTQPKLKYTTSEGLVLQATLPSLDDVTAVAQAPALFQRLIEEEEIQSAYARLGQPLTWQDLARRTKVKVQGKNSLQLSVKDTNPKRAALVANRWAALVVELLNERYGWAGLEAQLEPKVANALREYREAQAAYEKEIRLNRSAALNAQIVQAKKDLGCVLSLESQLQRLQQDLATFATYLDRLEDTTSLSSGDALALTLLQQRTLATQVCISEATNLQLQWPSGATTGLSVGEGKSLVRQLRRALDQRLQSLPEQQKALEGRISQLQQALEEENRRLKDLSHHRDAAWSTYTSLDNMRSLVQSLDSPKNGVSLLAGKAVASLTPVAPRTKVNVALAGILGLMLSSMGVLIYYWRGSDPAGNKGVNAKEEAV